MMRVWSKIGAALVVLAAMILLPHTASAATYKVLYRFCQEAKCADGIGPDGLVRDSAGNLYGTVRAGGAHMAGAIFQLSRDPKSGKWKNRVLYSFCPKDGCKDSFVPIAPPIIDTAGNLYGSTIGANGEPDFGVIYRLSPNADRTVWTYSILHRFTGKDGFYVFHRLSYAGAETGKPYDGTSPLYGAAYGGGTEPGAFGVVFQLKPSAAKVRWDFRVVQEFCQTPCGVDSPTSAPIVDADGSLYGTTAGTFYVLSPNADRLKWTRSVPHVFCAKAGCSDGFMPMGDIIRTPGGDFYGVTGGGGPACAQSTSGCGLLYTLAANGKFTVLHTFCARKVCKDGFHPSGVSRDLIGTLVGNTTGGGGAIFSFQNGAFRELHRFCSNTADCPDGYNPVGDVIRGDNGGLFGVTTKGGVNNAGVVYEIMP
jgi:uncharacterized repeat protein (TIGR03803 family)